MHPEPFNPNSRLRASDDDRDRAASVINTALAEGRLTVTEHSERLDAIYEAKTHAELAPLIEDLPARASAHMPSPQGSLAAPAGRGGKIIAIFGGASRKGQWHVESNMTVMTVFGGASLDFRDVELPRGEVRLNATCVFGGIDIVVPPGVRVVDSGVAIFGGRDTDSDQSSGDPDAPVLRLTGLTLFGGLGVKHKQRKNRDKSLER